MIFSTFSSAFTTTSTPWDETWETWVTEFSAHIIRDGKDGPCFIPGKIEKGGSHTIRAVKNIEALVLDIDHSFEKELLVILDTYQPYEFIFYTSHSHTKKNPRGRLVFPLNKPLKPTEFRGAWNKLSALIDFKNCQTAKNLNTLYYFPSCPEGSKPMVFHNEGTLLDPSKLKEPEGIPSDMMEKLIQKNDTWKLIQDAQPFAEPGKRHKELLTLTMQIAADGGELSTEDQLKIFIPSLKAMSYQKDPPTVQKVQDMLETAREAVGVIKYTSEELQDIALEQKCHVEQLYKRWILYSSFNYWYLTEHGYIGPMMHNLQPNAAKFLRLKVKYWTGTKTALVPVPELLERYGSPVEQVIADVMIQKSHYDADYRILYEATARRYKDLKPTYNKQIEKWLILLAGGSSKKLLDWVSIVPQLDKLSCGLSLAGKKGVGKTILAIGLSQLWGNGTPTNFSEVMSNFNERISQMPLIFADEYIPKEYGKSGVGILRQLIGIQSLTVTRKGKLSANLRGSLRIIMACNDHQMLDFDESLGRQSQEAIAQRILFIQCQSKAVKYLQKFSKKTIAKWIDREIAEYALWLADNRKIKPGKRFYVEGVLGATARQIAVSNTNTSLICEWIVGYLLTPELLHEKGLVKINRNRLYINNQALNKTWGTYLNRSDKKLNTKEIGQALASLAKSEKNKTFKVSVNSKKKTRLRYWEIDIEHIIEWGETNNFATREDIEKRLEKGS